MNTTAEPTVAPIRASDKLQRLFDRDERLIDVVAGHSPQLAKLRNSPIRRVMARVTTVAQAARLCKVDTDTLIRELNAVLGIHTSANPTSNDASAAAASAESDSESGPIPAFDSAVELDVRDELRKGGEPFSRIMAAVATLGQRQVIHLRAPFEPVPLFGVMQKRGFGHKVEKHTDDDWSVWFYRAAAADTSTVTSHTTAADAIQTAATTASQTVGTADVWLDVRDLEPPEPLVRTLEALETLPARSALMQVNARVPQFLLPILRERGFHFTVDETQPNEVRVRIWRDD